MTTSPDHSSRLSNLRVGFSTENAEAFLVTDLSAIFYLTGFRGSNGALVVSAENKAVLLVDGRYVIQAREQAPWIESRVFSQKSEGIADVLRGWGTKVLGFDGRSMTVDLFDALKKKLPDVAFVSAGDWWMRLRARKDPMEIALLKRANRLADEALRGLFSKIRPGISEKEIADELEYQLKKGGGESASFPILVASGERTALPHARPSAKKLSAGEMVFIDYGVTLDGYQTDQTLSFALGEVSSKMRNIFELVKEAHDRAMALLKPGASAKDVDGAAREWIAQGGYGDFFRHSTGHGIGVEVHEFPTLAPLSTAVLEEGMVVTVEPGVYLPGEGGVRIEDACLVTRTGFELLTGLDKAFRTL